ncbi:MAG: UvrD-helicase domain-containing protein [Parachlamydiales bacterium]|nr:UvrD-helicase domain-containing protein [Verrucomicrobiota bacterium]MBX3718240.1 UvrD-helicase domain-containing protein [Candidatus Acheromyda pituitae]
METAHSLNPQQQVAVNHIEGPMLVLAGAGSGKTRIVTFRVAHLLSIGVPASEILAVTFTNKAAEEMRTRILNLTHQSVLTCTFHSLCARILRESITALGYSRDFTIYDEEDSEKVIKECIAALNLHEEKGLLKTIKLQISQAKNALTDPEHLLKEDERLHNIYQLYQKKLKEYNALDFDDLLYLTVDLLRKCPEILEQYQKRWTFILIDEYQDTNAAQYTLTKLLAAKHNNVFAVGDPDQSIYSWRGANVHNILNFERDFPGAQVVALEQNYRSRSNILEAANALIKHNISRYEKNLWSDRGVGDKIGIFIAENDHAEAGFVVKQLYKLHSEKGIPLRDCVIFYRTNFQSRIFEDALLKERVPYRIIGGLSFYQRREIKDILALLRMVLGGADYLAFSRTINLPKRGLGEATLSKLRDLASEKQWDILTTCIQVVEGKTDFKPTPRQRDGLRQYSDMICALKEMIKAHVPLHEVISSAIQRSSYLEHLKEDPESYDERKGNIEELVSKAAEWEDEHESPTLAAFLEELTLKSSADEKEAPLDSVRLMTMHNGKGLEFTAVFVVGLEEDLFPHANAQDSQDALEEERRLMYVGMTRAKEYLFLTASRYRYLWGMPRMMRPSRFLKEVPERFLQSYHITVSAKRIEESSYEEEMQAFEPGDVVFHKDFGAGIVQKTYHTSLGLTYDVHFPQAGTTRSLVAKFAKLISVDEHSHHHPASDE